MQIDDSDKMLFQVYPVCSIDTKAESFTLRDLDKVIRLYRPYRLPCEERMIGPEVS